MLCGNLPYLLWHGSIPSYKHIKIWGVRVYIINVIEKKISSIIDFIAIISWDMRLLQEFLSAGIQTVIFLSTDPIILGLVNIIIVSTWKTSILQVIYYLNKTLKVFFVIRAWSTWFHVKLILHPPHFMIQKLSPIKLSYLPMKIKLVLIYWTMNILQSLMSFILYQIHQSAINLRHRLIKMCGSLLSLEKIT